MFSRGTILAFLWSLALFSTTRAFLQKTRSPGRMLGVSRFMNRETTNSESSPSSSNVEVEEDIKTYLFGKEGELAADAARVGIDPVRFISYNILAIALALGANFLGVTSTLMSNTSPAFFQSLKLDQLYTIGDFRRYVSNDDKYELIYPSNWEFDRDVLMAKMNMNEVPASMREKSKRTLPDVALGPPKGSIVRSKLNNVSVIKSKVLPGFQMRKTMGSPGDAAEFLLKNSIAPAASGKTYYLIQAYEVPEPGYGDTKYIFEYVVRKADADGNLVFNQHSVSAIMAKESKNELFTLTFVAPDRDWSDRKEIAYKIAESFAQI